MDRTRIPTSFAVAERVISDAQAEAKVLKSLQQWRAPSKDDATRIAGLLEAEFPDEYPPERYWNLASHEASLDFFLWGHNHDFGFGVTRKGGMGPRHIEIISECLAFGLLPADLTGKRVLDVGCWSGGDVLALTGLGGQVTGIEEHTREANSARRLCELVGCKAEIVTDSVYSDRQSWAGTFDVVYASGVIYHVTDPLLFIRILFAYLKPGGTLVLETKGSAGDDSVCGYSGIAEKGWNWYAPTREALGRWLMDAGFPGDAIRLRERGFGKGRLLSSAVKREPCSLPEPAGFSRPGSWLEGKV